MADLATPATHSRRVFSGRLASAGSIAGLCIVAAIAGPYLLDAYTVNILVRSFLYAATALTVDILWGYTGILTFGQAAFFGIGAYAAGIAFTYMDFSPQTAVLALAAGLVVSAVVAGITGWISFFHGASPLYVAIVTLALPIIFVQLLYSGGTFTGSSSGLVGYNTFDLSVEAWFTICGIGLVVLTTAAWFFVNSDFGRVLVAIRENEQRCTYLGINAPRVKILLMMVMAMIASVAGYAYAGYTVVVAPEIGSFVFGTELVMWVALGGRGTLIGPVLGTIAIDVTSAYLSGNLPYVWKLIIGSIFVLVIVALPQGIVPVLKSGLRRLWSVAIGRDAASGVAVPALVEAPEIRRAGTGSDAAALTVADLARSYGSLKVLEGVTFKALGSELLGIIGPNGAGKTTLMRCLSDGYERTGGTVAVFGQTIARTPPAGVVGFGIGRSFQTTSLFETLAVAECLRLARYRLDGARMLSHAPTLTLPDSACRVITATGLDRQLAIECRHLSHGMKRALELAMVLALEPTVLLLDEPTAGLTKSERTLIGSILVDLVQREGLCTLIIEHDLDFVREISTRIIVLHQGRVLLDGSVAEVVESDLVRTIYAGGAHQEPAR
jgi:ABC-type branched-subunit amino acid transport system ATPase component/ABC-type branched-subunit amino acid transport system permease subunit